MTQQHSCAAPGFEELADRLMGGLLRMSALDIELVQNVPGCPRSYRGQGQVTQAGDGALELVFDASEVLNTDVVDAINSDFNVTPGQVLGPETRYRLTFADECGRRWSAERIRPSCNWRADGSVAVTARLPRLATVTADTAPQEFGLKLRFPGKLSLPILGTTGRYVGAFGQVTARVDEDWTQLELTSPTPLPVGLDLRIQEALAFITATTAVPACVSSSNDGQSRWEFRSTLRKTADAALPAPLSSSHAEFLDHGWAVFDQYLQFVVARAAPNHWHPVTFHVHNAVASSANSLDAWAVGVSVAVEGLANLIEVPENPADKALIARLRGWLAQQMQDHPEFAALSQRVDGRVNTMSTPSIKDRLHHLAQMHGVNPDYAKAWGKLRNTHVHPRPDDLKALDSDEFQKIIDRLFKVTTLMYELVFHLIGYTGPYQDFGSPGFPVRRRAERR